MKKLAGLVLFATIITGCAPHQTGSISSTNEGIDESRARGLADHYYIASDVDPSERDTLDRHQHYQSFRQGCSLDFYSLFHAKPTQKRWKLREDSLLSGHLGTYRRFVSDSSFRQGEHDIPDPLTQDLEWFAKEFLRSPLMPFVLIIGHTNSDGSVRYNQALSEKRAANVHRYLVSQGIPEPRIHQFGVGETSPLMGGNSLNEQFLNRRVELVTFIPSNSVQSEIHCAPSGDIAALDGRREPNQ